MSVTSEDCDELRRQLQEGKECLERLVFEFQNRINQHDIKMKAGHLPPKLEKKFHRDNRHLQRDLERVKQQFRTAIEDIEDRLSEVETETDVEANQIRENQDFISVLLYMISLLGGSFEMSEAAHDDTANMYSANEQREIKKLHREFQEARTHERKQMDKLMRRMQRAEVQITNEERLLRYVAPSIYAFTATFALFRTMQTQQVQKLFPAMIEMGSLSLPAILNYFF